MPLYRIDRNFPELSLKDIDAGAVRAVACQARFPGVRWLRSYYDSKASRFTCYYEANDPDSIRRHAEMAGLPADSITEVVEYLPEQYRTVPPP